MGTVREHRRAWAERLLSELGRKHGEHGAKAMFAARAKTSPSFVYQVINGHRGIGDKFARKIEAGFHLTHGQIDGPVEPLRVAEPSPVYGGPGLNLELLTDVLAGLEAGLEGRQVPPEKRAQLAAALYEMYAASEAKPQKAQILAFVRRVA